VSKEAIQRLQAAQQIHEAVQMQNATLVLRPSMAYVIAGYVYTIAMYLILLVALTMAKMEVLQSPVRLLLVLGIFLIAPTRQAIRYHRSRTTITLDELVHETQKQRAELFLSHIEKVHVEQGLLQKLVGCGTVYIKKQDEITRTTLDHMDQPHKLAETILERARA
jgi:hypothetical protein